MHYVPSCLGVFASLACLIALGGCNQADLASTSNTTGYTQTTSTSGSRTTPPTPSTGGSNLQGSAGLDDEELAFATLINNYRAQNGAPALRVSVTLTQASDWMSSDMAAKNYFAHSDLQGRDPFTRMDDFGYTHANARAENIACGNATAQATFTQWKNSAGHNANMLNPAYRAIGIGRAYSSTSSYGWYWTTDFGDFVDATAL